MPELSYTFTINFVKEQIYFSLQLQGLPGCRSYALNTRIRECDWEINIVFIHFDVIYDEYNLVRQNL